MRVLAVIPARGGSKAVPRKNMRTLGSVPLIAHTIRVSHEARTITRTVVSTDDEEIAQTGRHYGADVPFMRPAELATDTAASADVALHALHACEAEEQQPYDILTLLQPTSPLRTATDIDVTVNLLIRHTDCHAAITLSPVGSCHPNYCYRQSGEQDTFTPLMEPRYVRGRRQDFEAVYVRNGAVYAVRVPYLERTKTFLPSETVAHIMPVERSINVDTEFELFLVNQILTNRVTSLTFSA